TDPLPLSLEVVGTDLWVASVTTGALQRFDLTRVPPVAVEKIDLQYNDPGKVRGSDIIPDGGALYVTQRDGASVARVNLADHTVQRINVPGLPNDGVVLDNTVWISADSPNNTGVLIPI